MSKPKFPVHFFVKAVLILLDVLTGFMFCLTSVNAGKGVGSGQVLDGVSTFS